MNFSKNMCKGATLALCTLLASSAVALAGGDVDYGAGLRNAAVAVPVPAPVPIPEVSSGFYVRLDAAYSRGEVSRYHSSNATADALRSDSNLDNFPRFGGGIGYYLNKWFRTDVTLDWRNDVHSRTPNGVVNYTVANTAPQGPIALRDTIQDNFNTTNLTGLLNAYVDMPASQLFTPYVGGGIGFVRHYLKGGLSRTTTCVDTIDCDPGAAIAQGSTILNSVNVAKVAGNDYALAVAAMAGVTYNMAGYGKLDIGYRYLHLQGTTFYGGSGTAAQNLKIPDQNIHEMRVGLRYDIN